MLKKQIIIRNMLTGKSKVFEINLTNLEDVIGFIDYNKGVLENSTYIFKNPISFQLVDLYLSSFSTPQPLNSIA